MGFVIDWGGVGPIFFRWEPFSSLSAHACKIWTRSDGRFEKIAFQLYKYLNDFIKLTIMVKPLIFTVWVWPLNCLVNFQTIYVKTQSFLPRDHCFMLAICVNTLRLYIYLYNIVIIWTLAMLSFFYIFYFISIYFHFKSRRKTADAMRLPFQQFFFFNVFFLLCTVLSLLQE